MYDWRSGRISENKGVFINYDLGEVGKLEGGHNFMGYSYRGITFLCIPVGGS